MNQPPLTIPPNETIWRLAIVDDHSIIRSVFRTLVEDNPELDFLWGAATLAEARMQLMDNVPDILIVDLTLPDGDGCDLIRETLAWKPDLRVLVVSCHDDEEHTRLALDSGARGYMTKDSSPSDILQALQLIQHGRMCFGHLTA